MKAEETEIVSYCPECSSIGAEGEIYPCCPDSFRFDVPRIIAEQARVGFDTLYLTD